MLDLSDKQFVKGEGVKRWSAPLNQLYRPLSFFEEDSQKLVYCRDNLNTTKFVPILLKEWFSLVAKDGYLCIDYKPNKVCDWRKLEENFWWLWKGKYEIIFHGEISGEDLNGLNKSKISVFIDRQEKYFKTDLDKKTLLPAPLKGKLKAKRESAYLRFVCKKKTATKLENDSMDKWTFGIITNGMRMDWMELVIESIRKQKIAHYEIL
ncbi:MAG: hypothetical protein HY810_02380 [Candidatus Omnitrophica bacterium]|nr:hypothetical protein [Candidatus Omnitrophota bacterium]